MERMENGILFDRLFDSEKYRELGFEAAPDENVIPLEELLNLLHPLYESL